MADARNSPIPIDRVRENVPQRELAQDDKQAYSERQSRLAREQAEGPPDEEPNATEERHPGG